MYGFNKKLNLSNFIGDSINIFGVYAYGILLSFHKSNEILLEGHYQIKNSKNELVEDLNPQNNLHHNCFVISPLLDSPIVKYEIEEPISLTFHFENGYSLILFDEDDTLECCTINKDIIV